MRFEPKRHLIKVQGGRMYLPVSARLIWFRNEHPDWGIETEPYAIDPDNQYAIFRAKIFDADGKLMAVGTKREDIRGFPDYIEKAETGAVGRALALVGYGTQFAPELDEVNAERFVDSPRVPVQRQAPHPAPARHDSRPDAMPPNRHEPDADAIDQAGLQLVGAEAPTPPAQSCERCEKPLTRSQQELSIRHYDMSLCPGCQKQRSAEIKAAKGSSE